MRVFIYVNLNQTQKHITIHYERINPCPHIMQQIISGNVVTNCTISDVSLKQDKSILKLGGTANSYWLLIHTKDCCCNLKQIKQNPIIQDILRKNPNISINICTQCNC